MKKVKSRGHVSRMLKKSLQSAIDEKDKKKKMLKNSRNRQGELILVVDKW